MSKRAELLIAVLLLLASTVAPVSLQAEEKASQAKPKVVVVGVNGAEWDFLRPLIVRGELPNLARVVENGTSGYLRTISSPNCPKVYTTFFTSVSPQDSGITGFVVGGKTANTMRIFP